MEKLPEDVMIEKILLKLPVSSLSNLKYVSKYLWSLITNPNFIKLQPHHSTAQLNNHLLLISTSHQVVTHEYKDGRCGHKLVAHNYACNFTSTCSTSSSRYSATSSISSTSVDIVEMDCPFESTEIRASCNGLLYLHKSMRMESINGRRYYDTWNYIWNPCTKEYKELPRPPPPPSLLIDDHDIVDDDDHVGWPLSSSRGFCGFGYDRTNDEYKILRYENDIDTIFIDRDGEPCPELKIVSCITEFKVYTLGTNTWTSIVDNPYKSFFFRESSNTIGLLVNGALHWFMCLPNPKAKGQIISFDIEKEVFRDIQKPHYYYNSKEEEEKCKHYFAESIQVLRECLCMCQVRHGEIRRIDIWMLLDYDVMDSWTKSFIVLIPYEEFSYVHFKLLRYCENGEIVMLRNEEDVIVYDPVNHKIRCAKKFNEDVERFWKYYMDYTESLVSLNSGTYTAS